MKLVVFGSTGSVGRHIVAQARAEGHVVTGFSRGQATEPEFSPDALVQGDVLDPEAVAKAVAGQDAVLVALGAGRKGGVRAPGTANVIAAMKRHGVRRLVCQSTLGAGESVGNLNFFWKHVMFGMLLRPAYADHQAQERLVRDSGLDWTIVRPAAFTDGPVGGEYIHGFANDARNLSLDVSRADVARFMLEQLESTTYIHAAPGLSYALAA